MTLRDIALSNLRRRKTKAMFVLAGLVIGVSTVVALLTLVDTMKQDINHKLEMYGANILIVPKKHVASLDERLNEKGYIVPGLGDAGDRRRQDDRREAGRQRE